MNRRPRLPWDLTADVGERQRHYLPRRSMHITPAGEQALLRADLLRTFGDEVLARGPTPTSDGWRQSL